MAWETVELAVIIGIQEDPAHEGVAGAIQPITDAALLGRLEDIVRSSISPPLLFAFRRIDVTGGYVLVADVWQSTLGPYMVEAYGERRYHIRSGRSTVSMTERQVRDAYFLAARWQDRRAEVWREHHLPIVLEVGPDVPWLNLAAIPEEPLREVLTIPLDIRALAPPVSIAPLARIAAIEPIVRASQIWADGLHANLGNFVFRLHRDGSTGLVANLSRQINILFISRVLHAQLIYLAWLWNALGIRTPVELKIRVEHLEVAELPSVSPHVATLQRPAGVASVSPVGFSIVLTPWELDRASVRHAVIRKLADRIYQAFGAAAAPSCSFSEGQLYDRNGGTIGLSLWEGAVCDPNGNAVARVYDDGRIERTKDAVTIAHVSGGVILDPSGDALAAVEMAIGRGLPDDFVAQSHPDPRRFRTLPVATAGSPSVQPEPTGRWSRDSLVALLPP